jgi:Peptidase family M28
MKTLFLLFLLPLTSIAQVIEQKDPVVEKMVAAVSADSLRWNVNKLIGFGTRHTLSGKPSDVRGIVAAREWVLSAFNEYAKRSHGQMIARLDQWVLPPDGKRIDSSVEMGNVMAILNGTDTSDKRRLIICAHLDSRVSDVMNRNSDAPGANDDASGVSAVMEAARVMSNYQFPVTIIFAVLSGEEQGLLGGTHLAEKAKQEQWDIAAVLNNDIIGGNNINQNGNSGNSFLRVFSEGIPSSASTAMISNIRQYGLENDGASRQLARYVKEMADRYVANLEVRMIYRNDRYLRGGDHSPFVERGFPAIRFTEWNENYDHQHQDLQTKEGRKMGDLIEFMDFEYLRKNTGVNVSALANLAKSPRLPIDVTMDVKALSNTTRINWKPGDNVRAAGYYVLMRETSSSQWEKKIYTKATQIELPYSKDNYFFAVQSVSPDGNESLPVIPSNGK